MSFCFIIPVGVDDVKKKQPPNINSEHGGISRAVKYRFLQWPYFTEIRWYPPFPTGVAIKRPISWLYDVGLLPTRGNKYFLVQRHSLTYKKIHHHKNTLNVFSWIYRDLLTSGQQIYYHRFPPINTLLATPLVSQTDQLSSICTEATAKTTKSCHGPYHMWGNTAEGGGAAKGCEFSENLIQLHIDRKLLEKNAKCLPDVRRSLRTALAIFDSTDIFGRLSMCKKTNNFRNYWPSALQLTL